MTDYQIVSKSVRIWIGLVARIPAPGRQTTSVPATNQRTVPPKFTLKDSELITEHG